jgi:hypothetical protein
MPLSYNQDGMHFLYPENWRVERQKTEEGCTVALQSPGAAFMLLSRYENKPSVQEVLETTLSALRQDYSDLEAQPSQERIADHQAVGFDIDFFSLDTVNSCSIRCFRTREATFLILSQSSGLDDDSMAAVMRAIRVSLTMGE